MKYITSTTNKELEEQIERLEELKKENKFGVVVFDTESTGLDTKTVRMTEFGARILVDGEPLKLENKKDISKIQVYFNPWLQDNKLYQTQQAYDVHGIDKEFLEGKKSLGDFNKLKLKEPAGVIDDYLDNLSKLLSTNILGSHNGIVYDIPLFNAELKRAGKADLGKANIMIDTLPLFRKDVTKEELEKKGFTNSRKLSTKNENEGLVKYLEVLNNTKCNIDRELHGALEDSDMLAWCIQEIQKTSTGFFEKTKEQIQMINEALRLSQKTKEKEEIPKEETKVETEVFTYFNTDQTIPFQDDYYKIGSVDLENIIIQAKEYGLKEITIMDQQRSTEHRKLFNLTKEEKNLKINYGGILTIKTKEIIDNKENMIDFDIKIVVKNENGYNNLMQLMSISSHNDYKNQHLLIKELIKYKEGLSFFINEENLLKTRNLDTRKQMIKFLNENIELSLEKEKSENFKPQTKEILEKIDLNILYTHSVKYNTKDDFKKHKLRIEAASGEEGGLKGVKNLKNENYLMTPGELNKKHPDIKNTKIQTNFIYPEHRDIMAEYFPKDPNISVYDEFVNSSKDGLEERMEKDGISEERKKEYRKRLEEEIKIIKGMLETSENDYKEGKTLDKIQFDAYLLGVSDYIKAAKNMGLLVGPARGSAAGSLIAYSLKITEIDPIKEIEVQKVELTKEGFVKQNTTTKEIINYGLIFERFINPSRVNMPDVDVDFAGYLNIDDLNNEKINLLYPGLYQFVLNIKEEDKNKEIQKIQKIEEKISKIEKNIIELVKKKASNTDIKVQKTIITNSKKAIIDRKKAISEIDKKYQKIAAKPMIILYRKWYFDTKKGTQKPQKISNVSSILTKGEYKTKSAIATICKRGGENLAMMLGFSSHIKLSDYLKTFIKEDSWNLDETLENNEDLKTLYYNNPIVRMIFEDAKKIEGTVRALGSHAAAVVAKPENVEGVIPCSLQLDKEGKPVIDETMKDASYVKYDDLGLKTLELIDNTLELISKKTGEEKINLYNISKSYKGNENLYELIQNGINGGLFQIESQGMIDLCKSLKPSNFEEISSLIALYRPGPMESGMLDSFISRKKGEEKVEYPFPQLEPILASTYGVMVYQEQIMQIVASIGLFSQGEADTIRRAMGKKDLNLLSSYKEQFKEGAKKQNLDPKKAEELFDLIIKFAGYGFNKSHTIAYAEIAYQTAYLKANYPIEFATSRLNNKIDDKAEDFSKIINSIKEEGLEVLPPNLENFSIDFLPSENGIIFGYQFIVGENSALKMKNIIDANPNILREDLIIKIMETLDKGAVEKLIKAGDLKMGNQTSAEVNEKYYTIRNKNQSQFDLVKNKIIDTYKKQQKEVEDPKNKRKEIKFIWATILKSGKETTWNRDTIDKLKNDAEINEIIGNDLFEEMNKAIDKQIEEKKIKFFPSTNFEIWQNELNQLGMTYSVAHPLLSKEVEKKYESRKNLKKLSSIIKEYNSTSDNQKDEKYSNKKVETIGMVGSINAILSKKGNDMIIGDLLTEENETMTIMAMGEELNQIKEIVKKNNLIDIKGKTLYNSEKGITIVIETVKEIKLDVKKDEVKEEKFIKTENIDQNTKIQNIDTSLGNDSNFYSTEENNKNNNQYIITFKNIKDIYNSLKQELENLDLKLYGNKVYIDKKRYEDKLEILDYFFKKQQQKIEPKEIKQEKPNISLNEEIVLDIIENLNILVEKTIIPAKYNYLVSLLSYSLTKETRYKEQITKIIDIYSIDKHTKKPSKKKKKEWLDLIVPNHLKKIENICLKNPNLLITDLINNDFNIFQKLLEKGYINKSNSGKEFILDLEKYKPSKVSYYKIKLDSNNDKYP